MKSQRAYVAAASIVAAVAFAKATHAQSEAPAEQPAPAPGTPAPAAEPPAVLEDRSQALPPPGPPRRDSQSPRPYQLFRERPRQRKLEIGPDFAFWHRSADGGSATTYTPDVAFGAHARIELREWLGMRLFFLWGEHGVDVDPGGLGMPDAEVEQGDLSVTQLGARIEPTWVVLPRLRLWAGVGASWARAEAPLPQIRTSAGEAHTTERAGVFIELGGALGATFDVLPERLAVWMSATLGTVVDETGDLFQKQQVITADSAIVSIGALPEMSETLSGVFGVALVL